jgi:hypothetical protein
MVPLARHATLEGKVFGVRIRSIKRQTPYTPTNRGNDGVFAL